MKQRNIILSVKNLHTEFVLGKRRVRAVNGVSFDLYKGEMLGIVGESGSGKSVTIRSILRLVPPPGRITEGEIWLEGNPLHQFSKKELRKVRGTKMAMIFQEPLSALNPSYTIGWQIEEVFKLHRKDIPRKKRIDQVIKMLERVKIPDAQQRVKEYPHQFSGGMRQRGLISIALASQPEILFADEPTTALDVTVQADIMDLIQDLRDDMELSVILISHNMNLIVQRCDRVIVMYAGMLMEEASSQVIIDHPLHPYTIGLMKSIPDIENPDAKLEPIPGDIADLTKIGHGCPLVTRCDKAMKICHQVVPEMIEVEPGHRCACHLYASREVSAR